MSELRWRSIFNFKINVLLELTKQFRRKADHEAANASRKLTPAQKKAKSSRKLTEDTSAGVTVAVYRWVVNAWMNNLGFV